MKRKRYSTEQIVAAIKQHELGTPAADIIRMLGIAEQTFYRWKRRYAGLEPGQVRELNQLREENARLKKLVTNRRGQSSRQHENQESTWFRMYYGSEFTSRILDLWAYHNRVTREFSRPGKPTDNGHIESFNGSLRDECLNAHWFSSLADAKDKITKWLKDYNESRPHRALNNLSPLEYVAQLENGA
jgi:transposase InsO family protein